MSERADDSLRLEFYIPADQEPGVYAHAAVVWHTRYDFTIDFAATQLPRPSNPDDPESPLVIPARVVARVRIPPTQAFDLIRAISGTMERYEAAWGEIVPPEPPRPGEGQ